MKLQQYQLWMKFPFKEAQPIWMHQLYLYLIDMVVMMAGAWIFLAVGRFILKILNAYRGSPQALLG